jgi:SAM-dependent methyltransferase
VSARQAFNAWLLGVLDGWFHRMVGDRKVALLSELSGTVVELGPGTGANLRYYGPDVRLIAVEPAVAMHEHLRATAARHGVPIEVIQAFGERVDLPDGCADAVVGTLVLCSVRDPDAVLATVLRLLKPGGRFVFLEHVAAPRGTAIRRLQELLRAPWQATLDGCHPHRETWEAVERAGFIDLQLEHYSAPTLALPIRPQIAGHATAP